MVNKEVIEVLSELSDSDLRQVQLLLKNKFGDNSDNKNVSFRKKNIKCGKESCKSCPHGPYWYAEWTEKGALKSKYLGRNFENTD